MGRRIVSRKVKQPKPMAVWRFRKGRRKRDNALLVRAAIGFSFLPPAACSRHVCYGMPARMLPGWLSGRPASMPARGLFNQRVGRYTGCCKFPVESLNPDGRPTRVLRSET